MEVRSDIWSLKGSSSGDCYRPVPKQGKIERGVKRIPIFFRRVWCHSRGLSTKQISLLPPSVCSVVGAADFAPWTPVFNLRSMAMLIWKCTQLSEMKTQKLGRVSSFRLEKLKVVQVYTIFGPENSRTWKYTLFLDLRTQGPGSVYYFGPENSIPWTCILFSVTKKHSRGSIYYFRT